MADLVPRLRALAVALVVGVLLVAIVLIVEGRRSDEARARYDEIAATAGGVLEAWRTELVQFERSLAFNEPDEAGLIAALAPSDFSFALLLDGDGRVSAAFPARPDIAAGDDLSGRFPHVDAVLDGADEAYWASDATTTPSGRVATIAVAGPGLPPTVLTAAVDLSTTALPRLLTQTLGAVEGAAYALVDDGTGITVLESAAAPDQNLVVSGSAGWTLTVGAPTSGIDALVGGRASWPARVAAVLAWMLLVGVLVRRRHGARAERSGVDGDLAVFQASQTPSLLVSGSGEIVEANAAAARVTGRAASRLQGAPLASVIADEIPADALSEDGSSRLGLELRYWADAEPRLGRVSFARVRDDLWVVDLHDLEEERQRHAILERQRVALEDLAGRLSHDLRTPITAMIGFADILAARPDAPADQRTQWAARVASNARQLGDYVRDMAGAAASVADRPATEVAACLARALRLHDSALADVDAEVVVDVDPSLEVAMPELLLRQVLNNLVDNAVKYRNRAIRLRIAISAATQDGTVVVSVADNGPGIPATQRASVFEDGFRSASDRIAGTGLGLAMCRNLVEDAHGTLDVRDGPDGGAHFVLRLPSAVGLFEEHVLPVDDLVAPAEVDDAPTATGITDDRLARYRPDEVMVRHSSGSILHLSPPDGLLAGLVSGDMSTGERLHPDDVAGVVDAFQAAETAPGIGHDVVARFKTDDNRWLTLALHVVHPLEDLGGTIIVVRPVEVDEAPARPLLDQIDFPALVIGHRRQLLHANQAARQFFGWEDDFPAHRWSDDLPDRSLRVDVLRALEDRVATACASEMRDMLGLVAPLDEGTGPGETFLVLLWPQPEVRASDPEFDELTGLPGPATVRRELDLGLRLDRDAVTAVIAVEIADLARANSARGRSAVDHAIQAVARRLEVATSGATITRQGAGEFLLVVRSLSDPDEASRLAERLRVDLVAPIPLPAGGSIRVDVSIGVAVADGSTDPDLFLIAATQALEDARHVGGPHVVHVN